jgi:hypothetical protein
MLEVMLIELDCTQEHFIVVASKGLNNPEDKKYYEQLIACDNFLYFKNMMIKRNIQIEEQAYQMMIDQDSSEKEKINLDPTWKDTQKVREQNEVECALAMSMALEEEKKRLQLLEDEELKRALELSKGKVKEEISLFDPTTLLGSLPYNPNKKVAKVTPPVVVPIKEPEVKEPVNIVNSTNVWKTGLNKEQNIGMTFICETPKPKPDYVDKVIEKTEKISIVPETKPAEVKPVEVKPLVIETKPVEIKPEPKPEPIPEPKIEQPVAKPKEIDSDEDFDDFESGSNKKKKQNQNLAEIQKKQTNFVLNHDMPDYSNVKSKIDTTSKVNKDMLEEVDTANEELKKKYQQIQKDKQDKLKAYRDMVLNMKQEKRSGQTAKVLF